MSRNNRNWKAISAARTALCALHPELFSLESPAPLKIGLHFDVKERYPDMPWHIIAGLFWWLTRRRAYLYVCTLDAPRLGFDGPSGIVDERCATYAKALFDHRESVARDSFFEQKK